MKALVVYDSLHGNTKKIANAIGEAISAQVLRIGEAQPADLKEFDLVIIGSPTHGGWYTQEIQSFIKTSPALEGIKWAVFDTRTKKSIFGFAGPRIVRSIEKNGGKILAPAEGFIVLGTKGPLMEGEVERAVSWAKGITSR